MDKPNSSVPARGPDFSDEKDREIASLRARLSQSQSENLALKTEVEALRGSTSWKLTGIVRAPRIVAMFIKSTYRSFLRQLAIRDGWGSWRRDIVKAFAHERLGLIQRVSTKVLSGGKRSPVPGSDGHDHNDYMYWRRKAPAPTIEPLQTIKEAAPPLFSVVMPVYRPPLHLLRLAVQSVKEQAFGHWELCIADDASGDPALKEYLESAASEDPRIKVFFREHNGHISEASNSALALATGRYVVLLDQDDLLSPDALTVVAAAIEESPSLKLIFSDEDRMNEEGTAWFGPYFKPDFSYDLLLAQNMVSHLGIFDRQVITDIGGFRKGLEGSQDHDLALRVIEKIERSEIRHIPKVLYHWRAIKGSAALDNAEKGYAASAGRQAVVDHIARTGQSAEVLAHPDLHMFNRVRYELPPHPTVDVLLVEHAPIEAHISMIERIWLARGAVECTFTVCTSESLEDCQGQIERLKNKALPDVHLVKVPSGSSWAKNVNQALSATKSDFVAIISATFTHFSADWLEELVRVAAQDRVGISAPRVRCEAGLIDHGGMLFTAPDEARYAFKGELKGTYGPAGRAILQQPFQTLSPIVWVARREVLTASGGIPDQWGTGSTLAGMDKCLSVAQGGRQNIWVPFADLEYASPRYAGKLNALNDRTIAPEHLAAWALKWQPHLTETAYNPNLSASGDFSLNWVR